MMKTTANDSLIHDAIFVVDDDPDDRDVLLAAFRVSQCKKRILPISNGEELINQLKKLPQAQLPGLILLDINMPGMNGRETLSVLKNDPRYRRIPVVILTTSSAAEEKHKCYELGANGFITKPSRFNEFVELMDSIARIWC